MDKTLMKKLFKRSESGQSLVELAISMVILLILLAGIVDLGRAIIIKSALQDAAEEGIIFGTAYPTDCNQIIERIRANLSDGIIPDAEDITINIQRNNGTYTTCYIIPYAEVYAGKIMRITITTDFKISMPFLGTMLGRQIVPITVTSNGIILRPPPPT
jgi:hypothetical protein